MTRILRTFLADTIRYYRCWRIKRANDVIAVQANMLRDDGIWA